MVSARSRERLHRSTLLMVGGVMLRASGLRERPTLTLLPFASRALLPSPSRCVALALFYRTTPNTIGCVKCEQEARHHHQTLVSRAEFRLSPAEFSKEIHWSEP